MVQAASGNHRPETGSLRRARVRLVACLSLDGRLAQDDRKPPNQESRGGWTSAEDKELFKRDLQDADIVIMGRLTAAQTPGLGKPTMVVSNTLDLDGRVPGRQRVMQVVRPDRAFILKALENMHNTLALLCGGGLTYELFLQADLVDEMVLTVEPVVLNSGPTLCGHGLFFTGAGPCKFELVRVGCMNQRGSVRMEYRRARGQY